MFVLVLRLTKLYKQFRPDWVSFLYTSFDPPHTMIVSLLVSAASSLFASRVTLFKRAPGILRCVEKFKQFGTTPTCQNSIPEAMYKRMK